MAARDEQIGKCTGHEQAMRVLFEPAIAHLGKAKHSLDNPDRMFDLGPHFGFGAVFGPLDLIDNTTVTVAAIGEIRALGACCRITARWPRYAWSPHTRVSFPCNRLGSTALSATLAGVAWTAWISLLRLSTPKCAFIPKYHWLPFFV
jgi:hypothetical protein